jgi:hypothetical protein
MPTTHWPEERDPESELGGALELALDDDLFDEEELAFSDDDET